jgi:hypothetical protein
MLWQCQFYLGYKAPINEGVVLRTTPSFIGALICPISI